MKRVIIDRFGGPEVVRVSISSDAGMCSPSSLPRTAGGRSRSALIWRATTLGVAVGT
jgi:hypothetical protein